MFSGRGKKKQNLKFKKKTITNNCISHSSWGLFGGRVGKTDAAGAWRMCALFSREILRVPDKPHRTQRGSSHSRDVTRVSAIIVFLPGCMWHVWSDGPPLYRCFRMFRSCGSGGTWTLSLTQPRKKVERCQVWRLSGHGNECRVVFMCSFSPSTGHINLQKGVHFTAVSAQPCWRNEILTIFPKLTFQPNHLSGWERTYQSQRFIF